MVNGAEAIGVRASIWSSDFIVGASAPRGVRLPWAKQAAGRATNARAKTKAKTPNIKLQAPEKLQTSKSKSLRCRLFGAWDLVFLWSLEFGAWSLVSVFMISAVSAWYGLVNR